MVVRKLRIVKYAVKVASVDVGDHEGRSVLICETEGITSNREGKWFGEAGRIGGGYALTRNSKLEWDLWRGNGPRWQ